eukprot:362094-Chlamydomonas_euryale.AAC.1
MQFHGFFASNAFYVRKLCSASGRACLCVSQLVESAAKSCLACMPCLLPFYPFTRISRTVRSRIDPCT